MRKYWYKLLVIFIIISFNARAANHKIADFTAVIELVKPTIVHISKLEQRKIWCNYKFGLATLLYLTWIEDYLTELNFPIIFDYFNKKVKTPLGSGVIISDSGYIITNQHLIKDNKYVYVKLIDGSMFTAKVIGTDLRSNLALLKVNSEAKLQFVDFHPDNIKIGEPVLALGNLQGANQAVHIGNITAQNFNSNFSLAEESISDNHFFQTNIINSAIAGSALFNMQGKMIGLGSIELNTGKDTNQVIIPANLLLKFIPQLKHAGEVRRSELKISVQEIAPALTESSKIKQAGILVVNVQKYGLGEQIGLEIDDLITHFNEQPIVNLKDLVAAIANINIGKDVKLSIVRKGEPKELITKIRERVNAKPIFAEKVMMLKEIGINLANSDKYAQEYGITSSDHGVIITAIDRNLCADIVQLRVGDVIIGTQQQSINNLDDFKQIYYKSLKNAQSHIVLLVRRGKIDKFITMPLKKQVK